MLQANGDDKSIPAHVFQDDGKRYLGVVLDHVNGSAPEQYTLRREPKSELSPPGVELRRKGANVEVVVGGKPLTEYLTDDGPKPYYFPVIGPTGAAVTRAFPMKTGRGRGQGPPPSAVALVHPRQGQRHRLLVRDERARLDQGDRQEDRRRRESPSA